MRLPAEENRSHKEILGFDSLDDGFPPEEHKELKRSDSHLPTSSSTFSTSSTLYPPAMSIIKNHRNATNERNQHKPDVTYSSNGVPSDIIVTHYDHRNLQSHHSLHEGSSNYDKVLLTPQDQYIPTLPKVIISASASVTDATGKKLNYSVGNVIASNIKLPPLTYDEYREDDVSLDPFFLDVPKIAPRRGKRSTLEVIRNTAIVNSNNNN